MRRGGARLHPLRLLSSVRVFLIVFAVMGLVNMFFARSGETLAHIGPLPITTGGLMVAVLYSCRLALVIILGAVFLATTTPTAMTDAFGSLLLPFRKLGWHTQEVALVMSLALRFLPTLSDETKAIIDAQSARGARSRPVRRPLVSKRCSPSSCRSLWRRCVTRIISVWRLTRAATRKASTAPIGE
mgnify:CR=1 FL=1